MNKNHRKVLERLMVFSCVTSFVLSLVISIEKSLLTEIDKPYIFTDFTYAVIIISGFVYMLALQLFVNEKTKLPGHLRFLIFYVAAILVLSRFLDDFNTPYVLVPLLLFHYFLESSVNDIFVYHDYFTSGYEGKKGKELIEYLFHNNVSALEFAEKRNSARNTLFFLGIVQFFVLLIPSLFKISLPYSSYFCALIFYFSLFIIFLMIGMFNSESYYAFLGFENVVKNEKALYKMICSLFIISLLLAVLISSNHAFLKIPEIHFNSFQSESFSGGYESYNNELNLPDMSGIYIPEMPDEKSSLLADIINIVLNIVKVVAVLAAVILVVFILFGPFFSDNWRKFIKEKRLFYFLKNVLKNFLNFISSLFRKDESAEKYATVKSGSFNDFVRDFIHKSPKSKEKRKELDRLSKEFIKLIEFGEKHSVMYRKNLAPGEYTELLGEFFKKMENEILQLKTYRTGKIFEKALYDKNLISEEEDKFFNTSIADIIAFREKE